MASGITSAKKLVIRTSLVTGSTLALIVGAQSLITLDLQKGSPSSATSTTASIAEVISPIPTTIISAPPSIVILRHPSVPGTPTANTTANIAPVQHKVPVVSAPAIQPPAPVVVQPPPSVIVQGSAPSAPSTHSTR